ncbi:hypothetical protein Pan97_24380 [Bremerella volcania]|uniref:Glycosyltransferase RgtA/B/C/D-like domain-containing protein n=1 Tax=Bremerella volcania TaxID=2527984 RepID=A0A518C848_9BACT|nr:DUF6044 family protein [Bremerella volcania]QDU75406.1 hypothetical protein Pan97_24380 [Bremerella volcania]
MKSLLANLHSLSPHALPAILGICAVAGFMLPLMIWGEHSRLCVQDVLDQSPIQQHRAMHQENPLWLSGKPDPTLLKGAAPAAAGPELRGEFWAYYFLKPFNAYLLNQWLSRLVAFFGMYLLIHCLLREHAWGVVIATTVAMLFACLNFYPPTPFTVPVLPWMAVSLLMIYQRQPSYWPWLVLLVAPLLGSFLLAPAFLLGMVWLVWFFLAITGRWHWRLLGALSLSTVANVVCSFALAARGFSENYVSHRTLWVPMFTGKTAFDCCKTTAANFVLGNAHVHTHHYLLLPLLLIVTTGIVLVALRRKEWPGSPAASTGGYLSQPALMLPIVIFLCALCSFAYGFWQYPEFQRIWFSIPKFGMINVSRFHWLHPVLWYLAIAYCLAYLLDLPWLRQRSHWCWLLIGVVFCGQAMVILANRESALAYRAGTPSYAQFFATKQFDAIRDTIGMEPAEYYVASLGMHPSVAVYNGFYCLDGYQSDHALDYHLAFREIIAGELDQSEELRKYFDQWGGRCYLFSSELGKDFVYTADREQSIAKLRIDPEKFREMGGRYILSAVEIRDPAASNLNLIQEFPASEYDSAWTIYLYRVDGDQTRSKVSNSN